MRHFPNNLLIPIFILVLLSGCSSLVTADQLARPESLELLSGKSLGQSLQARYGGLQSIAVYLQPGSPGEGQVRFHLRQSPSDPSDLARLSLPLSKLSSAGFYRFYFPAISASTRQDYYFYLEVEGTGSALVGFAAPGAYPSGSIYRDGQPIPGQMAFRLGYDRGQAATGIAREALTWMVYLAAAGFLFVIPGWALFSWSWRNWEALRWPEKLGLAAGASLAIYPLFFLWTSLAGVRLGALYAWLPPIAGLVALLWRSYKIKPVARYPFRAGLPAAWVRSSSFLPDLALLALAGLVFAVRFWSIRMLDVPMWGDSYQHSLIAQLLVDNHGLFQSWSPYADIPSFTYHFGLHSLFAVFHWITGQPVASSSLWAGQILNGLAALSLYPLATRVGRSPWAGVTAVLIAGLLAPMPMFYVNWGRYTQLTGQVILPAVVLVVWNIIAEGKKPSAAEVKSASGEDGSGTRQAKQITWASMSLAALLLAGLALTHYRVFIFALTFFAAVLLFHWRGAFVSVVRLGWTGLGAALLALPWMWHVFGSEIYRWLTSRVTTPATGLSDYAQQSNAAGDFLMYLPAWLWLLLPLALGLALWRREREAAIVGLWCFLTYLAANPQWLELPGVGVISSFTVLIAAYLPAAVLVSAPLGWLDEAARCRLASPNYRPLVGWRYEPTRRDLFKWLSPALLSACLILGAWGATGRITDVLPEQHALVSRPDMRAAGWIQANTPPEARFLVNSFFAYNNGAIVGSDAGWWLPLIAKRSTTLPPLNYTVENSPRPGYIQWVNQLTATVNRLGLDHPETLMELEARGVTHIYIGQKQGSVNNPGPSIDPQLLLASPFYRLVYHQDRVWIFQVQFER